MAKSAARKVEKSAEAYRSIGEAAEELGLQTHVLRYWEGKFTKFVKPLKRRDGRRMFRAEDIEALRAIQTLVHQRGMTLKGAEKLLREQGVAAINAGEAWIGAAVQAPLDAQTGPAPVSSPARALQNSVRQAFTAKAEPNHVATGESARLEAVLADLTSLKARLDAARGAVSAA
ncbi:MAG: MerR family transcriptional regulator [Pseudomonadota bacterium]